MAHRKRAFLLFVAAGLSGCPAGGSTPAAPAGKEAQPRIFTLAYPTTFLAQEVGGEAFRVVDVRPEHDDPETWIPTQENTFTIQEDAPVLLVGGGFEGWYRTENFNPVLTVLLADALGAGTIERPSGDLDPFFWMEPESFAVASQAVVDRLAKVRPESEAQLRARQQAFAVRLGKLESELRKKGQDLPPLFAAREGYAYVARALGLKLQTLAVDPGAPPTAEVQAQWAERKTAHPASVILFDRAPGPDVAAALRESGLKPVVFPLMARLPAEDRKAGRDYFDVYRSSVDRLLAAFGL